MTSSKVVCQWNHLIYIVFLLTSISPVFSRLSPISLQVLESVLNDNSLQLSPRCFEALTHIQSVVKTPSLYSEVNWPYFMAESIASIPPDVRTKKMANWVDFDFCLSIQTDSFGEGKYCLYRQHFNFSLESTQRLFSSLPKDFAQFFRLETVSGSICLPSACSDDEVLRLLQKHIADPDTRIEIRHGCDVKHSPGYEKERKKELFWQSILLVWLSFLFWATWKTLPRRFSNANNNRILDKNQNHANGSLEVKDLKNSNNSLLKCFSMRENTRILFQESNDEYPFLYFYRFIFLAVATGTHTFQVGPVYWSTLTLVNFVRFNNESIFAGLGTYFSHGMGLNFVWAGFLGFKGRYNELHRTGKFNFIKAYGNRLLRTLPTVFGCYLLILSFPRSLFSGPAWKEINTILRGNCMKNWWTELTFTQTCLKPDDMCFMPSWILAVDIQFFTASFLLIFLYYQKPKLTRFLVVSLIFCGIVIEGLYKQLNGYQAFLTFGTYDLKLLSDNSGIHMSTINYISSYFIGFFVAIAVHEKWKVSPSNMKWFRYVFWSCTLSFFLINYSWAHSWRSRVPSVLEKVLYGSIHRTLMALFAAGILYWNCSYHDSLRYIMNIRIVSILGQFNYSSYMGHFLVMYLDIGSLKQPLEYSLWSIVTRTTCILVLGIIVGFFIHLLFEAPFIRLSRHLFAGSTSKSQPKPIIVQTELFEENDTQENTKEKDTNIQENRSPIKFPTPPSMRDYRRKID